VSAVDVVAETNEAAVMALESVGIEEIDLSGVDANYVAGRALAIVARLASAVLQQHDRAANIAKAQTNTAIPSSSDGFRDFMFLLRSKDRGFSF